MPGTLTHSEHHSLAFDRRRGLRILQRRPVKLLDPRTGRYHPATTLDMSGTGLKLSIPRTLPATQGLLLHLHLGSPSPSPLGQRSQMLPVRIVWLRTGPSESHAGVELLPSPTAAVEAA